MKIKGTPNMLVRHNKARRIKGRRRGGVWFRFDSDGFVELDDQVNHRDVDASDGSPINVENVAYVSEITVDFNVDVAAIRTEDK